MKYDNYKIENLIFASNEVANWSIEEKREFLESCPENEHLSEAIEEAKRFREADENGEIKRTQYGDYNATSVKSWLSKNDLDYVRYGSRGSWDDKKYAITYADGKEQSLYSPYLVDSFINYYSDNSDRVIEKRFDDLATYYRNREKAHADAITRKMYKIEHADDISASERLKALLCDFSLDVTANGKHWEISDYFRWNEYRVLKRWDNGADLTAKDVNRIESTLKEVESEIAQIIEKHSDVLSMIARVCDVR